LPQTVIYHCNTLAALAIKAIMTWRRSHSN